MLGLAGLTLSEDPGVLQQPDFIRCPLIALTGQLAHGLQRRLIVDQPEVTNDEFGHEDHSTMCTRPVARRST